MGSRLTRLDQFQQLCFRLMCLTSQLEEMVVASSLHDDPELIYQAMFYDPLASAILDLREIRALTDDLFEFSKPMADTIPSF